MSISVTPASSAAWTVARQRARSSGRPSIDRGIPPSPIALTVRSADGALLHRYSSVASEASCSRLPSAPARRAAGEPCRAGRRGWPGAARAEVSRDVTPAPRASRPTRWPTSPPVSTPPTSAAAPVRQRPRCPGRGRARDRRAARARDRPRPGLVDHRPTRWWSLPALARDLGVRLAWWSAGSVRPAGRGRPAGHGVLGRRGDPPAAARRPRRRPGGRLGGRCRAAPGRPAAQRPAGPARRRRTTPAARRRPGRALGRRSARTATCGRAGPRLGRRTRPRRPPAGRRCALQAAPSSRSRLPTRRRPDRARRS